MSTFYASYPVTGGGGVTIYPSFSNLPATATTGSLAVTADTGILYEFNSVSWQIIGSPGIINAIGTINSVAKSANGANISSNALILQTADATNPGLISTSAQTLAGIKTFSSILNTDGGIDRSTSGTLTIGATNSSVINIGNAGATVNIQGTTIYENTPILQVVDPLITVNKNGAAGSGQNAGIEIEEAGVITGFAETSADRNSWNLKAPNTAGTAIITPGAAGITLNQSSHDPLTIGTANGLTLSTQQLSLGLSSATTTGALSSTDWSTFNSKQAAGNYITSLTGDISASGPGAAASSIIATSNSTLTTLSALSLPGSQVTGNISGTASNITATSNSTLTTLSALSLPGSQVTGNIAGNAANITATSNSTLTTLTVLSLPGSQVTGNISGNAANITATSNSTLTTLSALSLPGSQVTGNISGTASNITATSNSTLTTLSSLSLPASQLSGTVAIANGGTNNNALSVTAGKVVYTDGTKLVSTVQGTAGQLLQSQGTGAPTWATPFRSEGILDAFVGLTFSTNTGNFVEFLPSGSTITDSIYELPAALPTSNGQFLSSTTGGVMSWSAANIVAAYASASGTTAITTTATSITNLTTISVDTASGFSAGVYTVKVAGTYKITGSVNINASAQNGNCIIKVNGTGFTVGTVALAAGATSVASGELIKTLAVGDTVTLQANVGVSTGTVQANATYLSLEILTGANAIPITNLGSYQEGTFTPVVVGTGTAGTGTYTAQSGSYTKIGRMVYFNFVVAITAHTGTGGLAFIGLPFTNSSTDDWYCSINAINLTFTGQLTCRVNAASTVVVPLGINSAAGNSTVSLDTAFTAVVTGSYPAT